MCRKVWTLTIGSPCLLWDQGCERFVSGNRWEFSAAFIWRHDRRESMSCTASKRRPGRQASRKTSQQDLDLAAKRFKSIQVSRSVAGNSRVNLFLAHWPVTRYAVTRDTRG